VERETKRICETERERGRGGRETQRITDKMCRNIETVYMLQPLHVMTKERETGRRERDRVRQRQKTDRQIERQRQSDHERERKREQEREKHTHHYATKCAMKHYPQKGGGDSSVVRAPDS